MPGTTTSLDRGRITARVPQPVADTLQHAADLSGATLNQFVVQSALEKARAIIAGEERERVIHLSSKDAAAFVRMIENPPKPNKALAKAMARYKKKVNDGALDTTAGRTPSA